MLEEILINYEGTLLLVSHDRDFLDQTVTKVLAFEEMEKLKNVSEGILIISIKRDPHRKTKIRENKNLIRNKK